MKITISKASLSAALSRCVGIADAKSTMPILSCALLSADSDRLTVSATDLALSCSIVLSATVAAPGSVAVNARDVLERVKLMPDGEVSIDVASGSVVTLRAAGSKRRFMLHGISGDDFPRMPTIDGDTASGIAVDSAVLAGLIRKVQYAISGDDSRANLASALFECEGGKLRLVATDGYRLAHAEAETDQPARPGVLIPRKGVNELRRVASGAESLSLVSQRDNLFVLLPGSTLSVRLVDAQFPPYRQVIPDSVAHSVSVDRQALTGALKAVSVAQNGRTGGVRFSFGDGALRVQCESPDAGDGFDEIAVFGAAPECVVGLSSRYMLDALGAIDADTLTLGFSGELDPMTLAPGDESERCLCVVMPMRI